jgi:hypothetical protein
MAITGCQTSESIFKWNTEKVMIGIWALLLSLSGKMFVQNSVIAWTCPSFNKPGIAENVLMKFGTREIVITLTRSNFGQNQL